MTFSGTLGGGLIDIAMVRMAMARDIAMVLDRDRFEPRFWLRRDPLTKGFTEVRDRYRFGPRNRGRADEDEVLLTEENFFPFLYLNESIEKRKEKKT